MDLADELRRILEAGPPPDGDKTPLFQAILGTVFLLPCLRTAEGIGPILLESGEERLVAVYTHADIADRAGLPPGCEYRPIEPGDLCRNALASGLSGIAINFGADPYVIDHAEMTRIAEGLEEQAAQSESKKVHARLSIPDSPAPPQELISKLAECAARSGVSLARWSGVEFESGRMEIAVFVDAAESEALEALIDTEIVQTGLRGEWQINLLPLDVDPGEPATALLFRAPEI